MKRPGRPPKHGAQDGWMFLRAAMVLCAYEQARMNGTKHSSAVTEAVDFVRRHNPEMPISDTQVRRTLATFRSKYSDEVLLFEHSQLQGAEAENVQRKMAQLRAVAEGRQVPPPGLTPVQTGVQGNDPAHLASKNHSGRPMQTFMIRIAKRPSYPRHNAKQPAKSS